ncbi:hypothetical protein Ddc_18531 [Ditylenchus destructor]|nr:hypothetical protein Ddc_18531 [Ditylenchus destructor]
MMLSFSVIVALMPVMVLSAQLLLDLTKDLKTRIDDANQLITEANSFLPELQEGNAAGKNEVTSEIKNQAEKLDTVTQELTSKMERLSKDEKKVALKSINKALSSFKKPLKQFIKKVQKELTESDNNDAADDNDSCPDPNVLNSMLKEKTDKARQQIHELNTTVARRKRYASRKLKIKRALSYTIGLPVHIVYWILCLVNVPIGKTGFFLSGWLVFPWVMRIVSALIMCVSYVIKWVVVPKEDLHRFNEAFDDYVKYITETSIKIKIKIYV